MLTVTVTAATSGPMAESAIIEGCNALADLSATSDRAVIFVLLITVFCDLLLRLMPPFRIPVLAVLRKMEGFKLGDTGQLELVDSVERLQPHIVCRPALNASLKNLFNWSSSLLYHFPKLLGAYFGNQTLYAIGRWLGFRMCDFTATFELREKKIRNLDYRLLLDNGSSQYPDAIIVNARTTYGYIDEDRRGTQRL